MTIKLFILVVSIALMVAVVLLAAAGLQWTLARPEPSPVANGGLAVLALSGLAGLACLFHLWRTRKDHLA